MDTAKEFLKWLLMVFIGLWLVWFFTGGPQRDISKKGIFITPKITPSAMTQWKTYSNKTTKESTNRIKTNFEKIKELTGISLYKNRVVLLVGNALATDVNKEYIKIEASKNNNGGINITGWRIQSTVTGKSVAIGKGTYLPYTSKINTQEPVYLFPGGTAIVTTGRSPIGTSFRTNIVLVILSNFKILCPLLKKNALDQKMRLIL